MAQPPGLVDPGPVALRALQHQAGRRAAALALQRLGVPAQAAQAPLPRLPSGAAAWPAGCVGSISHTAWASHAAVAWAGQGRALGIDSQAPLDADTAAELAPVVADAAEQALLARLPEPGLAMTLLFSAKEAFYKALGSVDPRAREFDTVRLLQVCPPSDGPAAGHTRPPGWGLQLEPAAWLGRPRCSAWAVLDGPTLHCTVALGDWG